MKCDFPRTCIYCIETDKPKRLICSLKDIEINYHNLSIIEDCQSFKTYQKINNSWKKLLDL